MKAQFMKFGPAHDYRRAHVTLGNLLGEITEVYRNDVRGTVLCKVRHFNGDPWPIDPSLAALNILERA